MRKALRYQSNEDYWDERWSAVGTDAPHFERTDIYPIQYAEWVMQTGPARTAELGCGSGRVVKHYHNQGRWIVGLERSGVAVRRIHESGPYRVLQGDVSGLPFADETFDGLLAFGLFHNIENGLETAVAESLRCLKRGGRFCITMRPDNVEMRFNEWWWRRAYRRRPEYTPGEQPTRFHRWLVGESEFQRLLTGLGCTVERLARARNVPLLWRVSFLRAASGDESARRSGGYRLNLAGRIADRVLTAAFPRSFCNVLVYSGVKAAGPAPT